MMINRAVAAATATFCLMILFQLSSTLLSIKHQLFVTGEAPLSILTFKKQTKTKTNQPKKPTKDEQQQQKTPQKSQDFTGLCTC